MGIKAHKRKILICKTVRAVTETVGVIGMAATWIGVSHMTTKMQGYICGIADNSRIEYCPHCGERLGVYAYYGDGTVVCDECDLHFAVIECEEEE